MNFVILGSGPAGIFAAEAIRKRDQESPVTMVTGDRGPAQSPVMLSYWMTGNSSREVLFFRDSSWPEKMGIDVRPDSTATSLEPASRRLRLSDGREEIDYDRLLIATGGTPISLPIPGIKSKGVSCLRTPQDAETILDESAGMKHVVIIGGGFIGLKLAYHLKKRGLEVTLLEREPKLAVRMFDMKASRIIEKKLQQEGIGVETGVEVVEVLEAKGLATGAGMKDGRVFPCQRIVQGVGVRPNAQWLAGSGIKLKGGVLVNQQMETNLPGVYAAGDVAMTIDSITSEWVNNATWPSATRQGIIAGTNMAGGNLTYVHNFAMNALSLFGLQLMAAGHSYYEESNDVAILSEERPGVYRKLVVKEDRLIGFILIGDTSGAGLLLSGMKRKDRVGSSGRHLPPNLGFRHGNLFKSAT